ncbi:hypothetical protein SAMN05444277_110131 [Parafilimonas terrae]|uniref:Uncharacterized protein n=1 Tax=Parafilimonas terrae TaxID=1465490 RepID=A0A1I5Y3C0_9BACT|nr:hypothetical protein SAMN05444277_110131 [Parafilimonas terrae]
MIKHSASNIINKASHTEGGDGPAKRAEQSGLP